MSCHNIQNQLNDYIEQELSEEQSRQIEMHLNTCSECRAELSDLRTVLSLTRNLDEVEPPPFLAQRIMANVRESSVKKSLLNRLFFFPVHIPAGVLTATIIIFFSFSIYMLERPGDYTPQISSDYMVKRIEKPEVPLATVNKITRPLNHENFSNQKYLSTSGNLLGSQSLPDTVEFYMSDLQLTLYVKEIDSAAKTVLLQLIEMESRITGITSKKGEYRIVAEINSKNKQKLIQKIQQIGTSLKVNTDSSVQSEYLISSITLKQLENFSDQEEN